jgi:hypothetical protein
MDAPLVANQEPEIFYQAGLEVPGRAAFPRYVTSGQLHTTKANECSFSTEHVFRPAKPS